MSARSQLSWFVLIAAVGCGPVAPAATPTHLEYTASAPLFHDDLVWYSVVRHRPDGVDEAFVVTCGTESLGEQTIAMGIDAADCRWQDIGGPANASADPERRRDLALRAATVGAIDRTFEGELTDDDSTEHRWGSPYDDYPVRLRAGWTLIIDHMSRAFDCYLFLIGPNGEELDRDDDGGHGLDSRITHRAETDGTYIVRAAALGSSGRGHYTVRIQTHPDGSVPDGRRYR